MPTKRIRGRGHSRAGKRIAHAAAVGRSLYWAAMAAVDRRLAATCWLIVLGVVGLAGCVGVVRTRFAWVEVTSAATTKAEVRARFGEPRRATREEGREIWYYDLSEPGPSGQRPAGEGTTIVFALIAPIWWRTRPDDNVRFTFEGDTVVASAQLSSSELGFYCGVSPVHAQVFLCGPMP
jgi:hypothetical protein